MFYPITSLAVRQRKGELGAFGRIGTAARPWAIPAHFAS